MIATVIPKHDIGRDMTNDQVLTVISIKLIAFAQVLWFYPSDGKGNFLGKLQPVSQEAIQPILLICPAQWNVRQCLTTLGHCFKPPKQGIFQSNTYQKLHHA